jgi:hypothetical protein
MPSDRLHLPSDKQRRWKAYKVLSEDQERDRREEGVDKEWDFKRMTNCIQINKI